MRALISIYSLFVFFIPGPLTFAAYGLSTPSELKVSGRRGFLAQSLATGSLVIGSAWVEPVAAIDGESASPSVTDAQVKETVLSDILDRKFLVTGHLTPSIYNPKATFTDEIDTYEMNQWMKGTERLFVGEKSHVRLVGDVNVSPEKVEFRFDEDLMFRIPFRPVVSLTGRVEMKRDAQTGLITSYQEFWDQDIATVLKSAKF